MSKEEKVFRYSEAGKKAFVKEHAANLDADPHSLWYTKEVWDQMKGKASSESNGSKNKGSEDGTGNKSNKRNSKK